jgi:hypothetical protein
LTEAIHDKAAVELHLPLSFFEMGVHGNFLNPLGKISTMRLNFLVSIIKIT